MEDGWLAANPAEEVSKRKKENAPTPPQHTEVNHVPDPSLPHRNVTPNPVPSMEGGLLGDYGVNVPEVVEVDVRTDYEHVPTPVPNMVERDAQVHQSKRNNAVPSNVQSMVTGTLSDLTQLAANLAVVDSQ